MPTHLAMDIENHPRCPAFAFPKLSNPFFFGCSGLRFIGPKDFSVVQLSYYWWRQGFAGKFSRVAAVLIPKYLAGCGFERAA
jgi:hypothetical protein